MHISLSICGERLIKKSTSQACFVVLEKEFDSLDHSILLRKTYNLGFRGPNFELLKRYSRSCCQYVENDGRNSKLQVIKTGNPQGSDLFHCLCILMISQKYFEKTLIYALFADDANLIKIGKRDARDMNGELERVCHWFCQNKLT